jgi:hypothetical protein
MSPGSCRGLVFGNKTGPDRLPDNLFRCRFATRGHFDKEDKLRRIELVKLVVDGKSENIAKKPT